MNVPSTYCDRATLSWSHRAKNLRWGNSRCPSCKRIEPNGRAPSPPNCSPNNRSYIQGLSCEQFGGEGRGEGAKTSLVVNAVKDFARENKWFLVAAFARTRADLAKPTRILANAATKVLNGVTPLPRPSPPNCSRHKSVNVGSLIARTIRWRGGPSASLSLNPFEPCRPDFVQLYSIVASHLGHCRPEVVCVAQEKCMYFFFAVGLMQKLHEHWTVDVRVLHSKTRRNTRWIGTK